VANIPADREAYEIIVAKARGKKTYEQLAEERGESAAAVAKRVQRFKDKYVPLRRSHNERRHTLMLVLKWLGFAALAALAVGLVAFLYRRYPPEPAPTPAPSASAVPARTAAPQQGDNVAKPPPE
jgi:hypothetical protein